MARIIVTNDETDETLLDELHVGPDHLLDDNTSIQLLDRIEWAIREAHGQPWGTGVSRGSRRRRPARRPTRLSSVRDTPPFD